jgi:hypothetical protein
MSVWYAMGRFVGRSDNMMAAGQILVKGPNWDKIRQGEFPMNKVLTA